MNGYGCLLVSTGLLLWGTFARAFEPQTPATAATKPQQEKRGAPVVWRSSLNTNNLFNTPKPLSLGLDISTDNFGNQKITSYPQLNLTPEKSVSLSFDRYKPRVKFKAGSMHTAIKLRGDGIKMQFNPVDKTIPLQIEIKVTDDESSLRVDYRF